MSLIPAPSGISFFEYEQEIAASVWTINHNLNYYPALEVQVFDGPDLVKVFPFKVEHVSLNTVEITFTANRAGRATLAAPLDI